MNNMNDNQSFVVREILFCRKGEPNLHTKLVIHVRPPYLLDESSVNFKFDEGASGCAVEFEGLSELNYEVFGVDKLHALALAVDVDPSIKSLTEKYDFYWLDGSPYFDE
jgi:hypothetical protein